MAGHSAKKYHTHNVNVSVYNVGMFRISTKEAAELHKGLDGVAVTSPVSFCTCRVIIVSLFSIVDTLGL